VSANEIDTATMEDVQGRGDTRRIPINRVGVKDMRHPVRVKDRTAGEQHTIATFNMYVNLPHDFKGTHMSRFVEILHNHEREISVDSFRAMLEEMTERLEADAGHIEMSFPFFVMKKAPVSGVESLMDYGTTLVGERHDGRTDTWIRVVVPVTSLCPCSKSISPTRVSPPTSSRPRTSSRFTTTPPTPASSACRAAITRRAEVDPRPAAVR